MSQNTLKVGMYSQMHFSVYRVGGNGINTKLNFTDAESFVSVPSASIEQGKQASQGNIKFHTTSELERKVCALRTHPMVIILLLCWVGKTSTNSSTSI